MTRAPRFQDRALLTHALSSEAANRSAGSPPGALTGTTAASSDGAALIGLALLQSVTGPHGPRAKSPFAMTNRAGIEAITCFLVASDVYVTSAPLGPANIPG